MPPPVLDIRDLAVGYGKRIVCEGISLTIHHGERWAVIGPNGCGKSTLLRTCAGHLPPLSGSMSICGIAAATIAPRARAQKIAYVPQPAGRQFPPFSVRAFVNLARHPWQSLFDTQTKSDRDAVEEALNLTETAALSERLLTELSGGELQRVLLAGAVAQNTPLALLDEPESFLDPHHVISVRRALARIHTEHDTAFFTVLHDMDAASRHTHVLALARGQQLYAGPSSFLTPDLLEEIYGIPFEIARGTRSGRSILIASEDA